MEFPKFNLPDFSKLKLNLPDQFPGTQSIFDSFKQPNMEMRDEGMIRISEISSSDFLNDLYKAGENFHLGKKDSITRVSGIVKVDLLRFQKKYGVLENIEFEHSVIFMDKSDESLILVGECIVFLNCKFEKTLFFRNCKFNRGTTAVGNFEPRSIEILGGNIKEVSIDGCELHGILFSAFESNPLKIGAIDVKNCDFLNGSISFENTEITEMCDIIANKFNHGLLRLVNNKISSGCRFSANKNLSLQFYGIDSVFEKPVFINHGDYKFIEFKDVHFSDEVTLIACSIVEEIKLIGNTFEDRLWILSKDVSDDSISNIAPEEIWIQNNKFQNGFKYNSERSTVNNLNVIFSEKSSGVIEFEDIIFKSIDLLGNNFNNSLFFRNCLYFNLNISNFFNKALISFNNNCPDHINSIFEELKIENSNLGNTEFYDFDFSFYATVRIIDSRLDNIFVNGVKWFNPNQLHVDEAEMNPKKILLQKREIYRQLKLAAEKQSDRITSLKFKAIEVETHNELLGQDRFFSKKWFKQIGDITAIWAGSTNNHGQNWEKALGIIIGITLIVFYPLIISCVDPELTFWPINSSWKGFGFFWNKYIQYSNTLPELFNLVRRTEIIYKEVDNLGWLRFWDGIHRIILAFFIFQIVSAFRKFVK